ncbi:2-oxoacid:acceptor oxidoreductase family protein [Candidatus Micrarchaeota archaeon]|nr:2-oxoacid:acceptor oxidoreductase family protein [Candidatus Micrarchaeota archaeon]MBU1166077.1 2-oxoacid:acceptor oxidoreductase family protein [Candidatus Micrarchaeota archaeon]MBU1886675.1 2-oxoacid:acceptor oxidoreductase family protein [Candidatus Micrarchaeota archaeon]
MFDLMLTGVGGEGVLTAQSIIAKAAQMDGYFISGLQLHGLAQRGGTIPAFIRFTKKNEAISPTVMISNADLIMAFEPLEAVRATQYANKKKTTFIINNWPHMPIYANILDIPYPEMKEIEKRVLPFAKKVMIFDTHKLALYTFGIPILGNTMLIGAAIGTGNLPIREKTMKKAISETVRHGLEMNMNAFEMGLKLGKK